LIALFPAARREVVVPGADVHEILRALDSDVPGVYDRLVEAGPAIREHINVFVDGERASLDTPVGDGSTVHVIPAVSGG
jgi:molybdopterin converting factor small subunit